MVTLQFEGSPIGWLEKGTSMAMNKKKLLRLALICATAAVFAAQVRGDAGEEIGRLAELMGWKAGTVVADIGAGDGAYAFAAVERGGGGGGGEADGGEWGE